VAVAATGVRPPRPANWADYTPGRRLRTPDLTGGPGAVPGGVASKNGQGHMRVQRGGHFL